MFDWQGWVGLVYVGWIGGCTVRALSSWCFSSFLLLFFPLDLELNAQLWLVATGSSDADSHPTYIFGARSIQRMVSCCRYIVL